MLHEEITKDIIGAAMAVLNELRPGLDEKLYENALVIELLGYRVAHRWCSDIAPLVSASPFCNRPSPENF